MNKHFFRPGVTALVIIICAACMKVEEYPDAPVIKLESFTRIYNPQKGFFDRGILTISFTDGDGDIGLGQGDTLPPFDQPPYDVNLVISYYEIRNGDTLEEKLVWFNNLEQRYDTISHSARIPPLAPKGSNKPIKGAIEDTLYIYNYYSTYDTMLFKAYIVDRALNKSNEIITPIIVRR